MDPVQRVFFRDLLREARAAALKDAEGFRHLIHAIDRLGAYLAGRVLSLGRYETEILALIEPSPLAGELADLQRQLHPDTPSLYRFVVEERNAALHEGAYARHLTTHLLWLAITIEHALTVDMTQISDFCVHQPVIADIWQPISFVRQTMLVNSFSFLPIRLREVPNDSWYLISDFGLASFLRSSISKKDEYKRRLAMSVGEAIEQDDLSPIPAYTCAPDVSVGEVLVASNGLPILVVRPDGELLGIATSFDLL